MKRLTAHLTKAADGTPLTGHVASMSWVAPGAVDARTGSLLDPQPAFVEGPEGKGVYYVDDPTDGYAAGLVDTGVDSSGLPHAAEGRYHELRVEQSDCQTFVGFDVDQDPLTDLEPEFASLYDYGTTPPTDLGAGPTISQLASGLIHKFTPAHLTKHVVGTITLGGSAFPAVLAVDLGALKQDPESVSSVEVASYPTKPGDPLVLQVTGAMQRISIKLFNDERQFVIHDAERFWAPWASRSTLTGSGTSEDPYVYTIFMLGGWPTHEDKLHTLYVGDPS